MFKKSKSAEKEGKLMDKPATSDFSSTPTSGSVNTKTVLGERITINGDIRGAENLVIEGSLQGMIELEKNHITIGPKGRVNAEIKARDVAIMGQLKGNVQATGMVKITKDAKFDGEIKSRNISVEDGAYLKAAIELQRDPIKSGPAVEKTTPKPTPGTIGTSVSQPTLKGPPGLQTK